MTEKLPKLEAKGQNSLILVKVEGTQNENGALVYQILFEYDKQESSVKRPRRYPKPPRNLKKPFLKPIPKPPRPPKPPKPPRAFLVPPPPIQGMRRL